jgi:tricorn protease interacting factor F2/3
MNRIGELTDKIVPLNYKLDFDTDLETLNFYCNEKISINAKIKTKKIILNSKDLNIKKILVIQGNRKVDCTFDVNNEKELLIINLSKALKGKITLSIDFIGKNNNILYGFYYSTYKYKNQNKRLLTTQFEASAARMAFPCFDEPKFKATFDVSIISELDFEAISNMPVKKIKILNTLKDKTKKRKLTIFYTTPKMSTYLLYLGVGRFDRLSTNVKKTKLSVLVTEGNKKLAILALEYSKRLLSALEDYFGIDFPLPKLDLIGIPDFSVGAMENWGAITFRETALLADKNNVSIMAKQRIAEVICHEMVHQWFGDLVTMKWWDDLWLNESFATFMAYKIVDKVFPEFKMMIKYYPDEISDAFAADSLISTHPINVKVKTPGEIASIFDEISYNKGGSILLMIEDFLGSETFRNGLYAYLKKYSYRNATRFDLWNSLSNFTKKKNKKEFVDMIKRWIDQAGYPILYIKNDKNKIILEQKRFTIIKNNDKHIWHIPIHYKTNINEGKIMMKKANIKIDRRINNKYIDWIKLNYNQCGFYKIFYDTNILISLKKPIQKGVFSVIDLWGIENDLFMLVRCGNYKLNDYINFLRENLVFIEYPLTNSILNHLNWIRDIGYGNNFSNEAEKFAIELSKKVIDKLGNIKKDNESVENTLLRSSAQYTLAKYNDKDFGNLAISLFDKFIKNKEKIDQNILPNVYFAVARIKNNREIFDTFLDIYKNGESPQEKIYALSAIGGGFTDKSLLVEAYDLVLSNKIRLQDFRILAAELVSNINSKEITLNWVFRNWSKLKELFLPTDLALNKFVSSLSVYSDSDSLNKILMFFNDPKNIRDDIKSAIKHVDERINANINFLNANK